MAPRPKELTSASENNLSSQQIDDNRIFISGMSGLYPQAHNIKEFSEILYNKVNPVTSAKDRWNCKHPELADYVGIAPGLDQFDAQFFTVYYRLGQRMDPMSRKILEQTYQALYDAGLNPGHLSGKKVAVFIGTSFSDVTKTAMDYSEYGLGLVGTSKNMFANRISYWLKVQGQSLAIDEADCSSTAALEQAYLAMKHGECEAAIVGGAHLYFHPENLIHHNRVGLTSKDGKTYSYAQNSKGYTLSDAIGILILQKSKDALRCYAELRHVKNEFISVLHDEMGPKFNYNRNPQSTINFINKFYEEAKLSPQLVEYVEGYGTGVPDADKSELEAIEEVYCKDRGKREPLLVGSVTSNIGLTETASVVTAISKVLLGYHKGQLAANLNCENPRNDIAALRDGRMRIVTEHQSFQREYTAINGMSFTGINSHVLLQGHYKSKDLSRYKSSIPRLVVLSGRNESSIEKIFDSLKSQNVDPEQLALLHNIHSKNIGGHLGRGFIILDTDADQKTVSLCEKTDYYDDAKRPLWFVYSGMGSQWPGMGTQLMRIPIFASAVQRCDQVLKSKGLDIVDIITSTDKTIFDNILHAFVGIATIQIGLTDVLRELGIVPDGIIGHSVGELGCAYADGCITAQEMLLAVYSRGLVSLQTPLIKGSMAAVGLGYDQISTMCPPEIDVACRNSFESSTISGPADKIRSFVSELTSEGIFAKEVPTANIAYHSRYIADAGPKLLKYLNEVIKNPKRRSERWLSTSVPQHKWHEDSAQYCSAAYHTNNLLNPVLFEETLRMIPSNAVLVEIAPHGLLQAILRRALPEDCRHVPLTKRGHADNTLYLLEAIGKLYMNGYTPNVQVLYPKVQFPVSTETPMLSHLVEWVHTDKWSVPLHQEYRKTIATCKFVKSIYDEEYKYLQGNVIRGKTCYPFAAALVAAWDTFSMIIDMPKRSVSVRFRDVHLYAQPLLLEQRTLKLEVAIQRGTGWFEIMNEYSRVMTGYIIVSPKIRREFSLAYHENHLIDHELKMTSEDIYQLLHDREYEYSGEFRSIESASASLNEASIAWRGNWVTLIDGMLQLNVLRQPHDAVSQPTHIGKICIDVIEQLNHTPPTTLGKDDNTVIPAMVNDVCHTTRCGGVFLQNIQFRNLPAANHDLELCVPISQVNNINHTVVNGQHDVPITNKTLQLAETGKLDSLQWVELPELEQSNVTVKVHFAGLNMLDVKRATGVTSCNSDMTFGMDYSGTTNNGDRVMGIIADSAASNQVIAQPELLWPVPAHWSLEDAATVPLPYAHAFYALIIKGALRPGMSVLVHGGAGAFGQAIIAIALAHNSQVFTTTSDVRKKQLLQKLFPKIKGEHIGISCDLSFYDTVMTATKGQGCNIVISCVKGEFKQASLRCCGLFGMFIDTVQINEKENFKYGMYSLEMDRSYYAIDFSSLFIQNQYNEMQAIQNMLSEGISAGYVVPLTRVTYAPHEVARAFRLLGSSRHRGRVLLRMCDDSTQARHSLICDPKQCQVLFWDNDAHGVQLADKLIHRGARKLCIYCTKLTAYLNLKLRAWQRQFDIQVIVDSEHLTKTKSHVTLNDALNLGNIEGIYVVMSDPRINFSAVLKDLDSVSRLLCSKLRHFVLVSTVKDLGRDVCLSRVKSGHTATYLDLSGLSEAKLIDGRTITTITELALCNRLQELTKLTQENVPTLVEQIADLADVHISSNTGTDITLQELGMKYQQTQLISIFLNNTCNISLDESVIPFLTIDKIKELHKSVSEIPMPNIRGLKTFFSNIDHDTIAASADFILLPTLYTDDLMLHGFGTSERYLCIVPGTEGNHLRFYALCERLKMSALVLQPELDQPHVTVTETALRYAEILQKKTELQDNFYLLGYENGVSVALELAAILEEQGLTGTVFCLGFAPAELQAEVEEQLFDLGTEEQLQDAVVRHMFTLMTGEDETIIETALQQAATWKEKVDTCLQYLHGRTNLSLQYVRALIEAAPIRIEQMRRYSPPEYCLRSQLVLLQAATTQVPQHATTLQQYTQKSIIVHQLGSPLSYILNDTQCASLVNRYFDDGIQKAFDTKNLCQFSS